MACQDLHLQHCTRLNITNDLAILHLAYRWRGRRLRTGGLVHVVKWSRNPRPIAACPDAIDWLTFG